jgi:hypothetical protein
LGRRIREIGEGRQHEQEALRRVRAAASATRLVSPPVTVEGLERLARRLDVDQVAYVPLAEDGRLRLSGARVIVEVKSDLSEFEQRFTLAHELAHRVIETSRMDQALLTGRANRDASQEEEASLEALCDLLAGELLLPEEWVLRHVDHETPTIAAIRVAEDLGYPIEFVISRIFELRIWGGWSLTWRVDADRAVPVHVPDVLGFDFKDNNVAPADSPLHLVLRRARDRAQAPLEANIEVYFGQHAEQYEVEAFPDSRGGVVTIARRRA